MAGGGSNVFAALTFVKRVLQGYRANGHVVHNNNYHLGTVSSLAKGVFGDTIRQRRGEVDRH